MMRNVFTLCAVISLLTFFTGLLHVNLDDHALATEVIDRKLNGQEWRWPLFLPLFGIITTFGIAIVLRKSIKLHMSGAPDAKHNATTMMCLLIGPVLFFVIAVTLLLVEIGYLTKSNFMKPIMGLAFMYFLMMGNYITTTLRNSGNGFRTPWALRDDVVWEKTQRFCGRGVFVLALTGLGALFFVPTSNLFVTFGVALVSWKVLSAAYSWLLWRQMLRQHTDAPLT